MQMMPIQRLSHVISETQAEKWGAASLLMVALPDQLREEVISSKRSEPWKSLQRLCYGFEVTGHSKNPKALGTARSFGPCLFWRIFWLTPCEEPSTKWGEIRD